jgi:hypothetical protein
MSGTILCTTNTCGNISNLEKKTINMVIFLIPVRHPSSAADYAKTWQLLINSLRNIARQTDDNWHDIVTANKILEIPPNLPLEKLTFLTYNGTAHGHTKTKWNQQEFLRHMRDKASKRMCGVRYAIEHLRPTWYFMMDADDYVANDLVQTIHTFPANCQCFTIDCGVTINSITGEYTLTHGFNQMCGTSIGFSASLIHQHVNNGKSTIGTLLGEHIFSQSGAYVCKRHQLTDRPYAAYIIHDDNHGLYLWGATRLVEQNHIIVSDIDLARLGILGLTSGKNKI